MGYQPPSKTSHSSFLKSPPLNWQTVQVPFFLGNPHSILVFHEPPSKSWIFQWTPKYLSFSSLTPSYLLTVTKFLVKISQFEFLVMREKNIFAYKPFLLLNISDFKFSCENCKPPSPAPPWKSSSPLSQQFTSKSWGPVKSQLLENLVGALTPLSACRIRGLHTMSR